MEEKEDSDSDQEEPKKTAKEIALSHRVGKKTKKRKKKLVLLTDFFEKFRFRIFKSARGALNGLNYHSKSLFGVFEKLENTFW